MGGSTHAAAEATIAPAPVNQILSCNQEPPPSDHAPSRRLGVLDSRFNTAGAKSWIADSDSSRRTLNNPPSLATDLVEVAPAWSSVALL